MMKIRVLLLAGVSAVALEMALAAAAHANSVSCLSPVTTNVGGPCDWGGGNFSISSQGSISGATVGVAVTAASVGTLVNNGQITGGTDAFLGAASGAIAGIVNSGTILSTGSNGVTNNTAGSIGDIVNSGLISSLRRGIDNEGTIGSIVNQSGGTIFNSSDRGQDIANNGSIGSVINNGLLIVTGTGSNTDGVGGTALAPNPQGITNYRTIGQIINTGQISITGASSTGIYNGTLGSGAAIGAITNSGSIVVSGASAAGIGNYATIGTVTNTGSIGATGAGVYGLFNRGAVASFTNDGIISASGSNAIGIYDRKTGSIGSLVNDGTISATGSNAVGVKISGVSGTIATVTSMTNAGTISGDGGGVYVGSYAVLGQLSNSGVISGAAYALSNGGSIGTVVNSGVISGAIDNSSAFAMTIVGGSGATFGTLTGVSGAGQISSTSADLVFASGNILLQDNVDVTGHTLSNTGATIKLTSAVTPTITGAYAQTAGGLLVVAGSASDYGAMSVTGNASVSGSTVTITGTNVNAGNTLTIVRSGATGSYSGDSATLVNRGGLIASVTTVSNDLVVTLAAKHYTPIGDASGGTAAALGPVLDQINSQNTPVATAFQNTVLLAIDALPSAQQGEAIKQLAPIQSVPSFQMSSSAASAVLGAVEQHQQTAMAYDGQAGAAAGSDAYDTALWGQMLGGGAIRGSTAAADGYKTTDFGLASGVDRRFTPNTMGGVAFSWLRGRTGGTGGSTGSTSTLDSYQLTVYGTYRQGQAFVDGQLGAGYNRFNQKRAIPVLGQTASADYDGQQYLARAAVGYDLPLSGLTLTPLAGLSWLLAENDGYTEHGSDENLSIDQRGVNTVSHDLGAKVSWSGDTGLGTVKQELRAAWVHDYTHGPIVTSGLMGGQAFATTTPRPVADGAQFGVAATLNGTDAMSFRVEYAGELRAKYQSHTGLVKVLWGF